MTTYCSKTMNYNNSNNIYTLTTAQIFDKSCCGQADGPTDRQTDIATCRAAIAAKKNSMNY